MTIHYLLPSPTEADNRWREYKGFVAVCGDCVECTVVNGKAVEVSKQSITGISELKAA